MRQNADVASWVKEPWRIDIRENLDGLTEFLKPEDSILDVGCYAGYLRDYFSKHRYIGIDLFPEHIALAKKLHPDDDSFKVGDVFNLEDRADVVICLRVLIHIPEFERAVRALWRATGRLLVVGVKIGNQDTCEVIDSPEGKFYYRVFSRDTINRIFGHCVIQTYRKCSNIYKWKDSSPLLLT